MEFTFRSMLKLFNKHLRLAGFLSMVFFLFASHSAIGQNTNSDKSLALRVQESLHEIFAANPDAKGLMVHIESERHHLSLSAAEGYSNWQTREQIIASQPAMIASSIKTYMAAAILRLVEDNKISIDSPIGKFITEKTRKKLASDGYNLDKILIKHLLSHTSGIQDYVASSLVSKYLEFVTQNPSYRWTRDEQLQSNTRQA